MLVGALDALLGGRAEVAHGAHGGIAPLVGLNHVLVGVARLKHLLQRPTLAFQFLHRIVLPLERVLQIADHLLFHGFEAFNALFAFLLGLDILVGQLLMLDCGHLVVTLPIGVVALDHRMLLVVSLVGAAHLLILLGHLLIVEAGVVRLQESFQFLAVVHGGLHHTIAVSCDGLLVGEPPLIIQLSQILEPLCLPLLVGILRCLVVLNTLAHLVSQLRVLIGNSNLLVETLFF